MQRLIFALAAPLIPLVRWNRIVPIWKRCLAWRNVARRDDSKRDGSNSGSVKHSAEKPRGVLPLLAAALVVDAFGEWCGYTLGAGKSRDHLWSIEFDRRRFMRD